MNRYPNRGSLWSVLILVLLLSACGFHLRGSVELPPMLERPHVVGDAFSLLVRELESLLLQSGATLVRQPKEASAIVRILSETPTRRVLSVGSTGKAAEYELHYAVNYQLENPQGEVLQGPSTLSTRRTYLFDESQVLGKSGEEETLREDMQRDLARRLLQQLSITGQ